MNIAKNLFSALGRKTIEDAVKAPHIEQRALAVQKIGRTMREASLSSSDREFAEKILSLICQDVSDIVRRALAVTLQNSPNLPHKIAHKLIHDIDSIAVPVLKHSPVLTDDDLRSILKSKAATKVKAIAQRQKLSAHISNAIISFGDGAAVADLAANDSAMIDAETAAKMAEIYADDDLIREAALSRQDMPADVVQNLVNAAARQIEKRLESVEGVTQFEAADIANRTQQRALLSYVDRDWSEKALIAYIETLHERGQLGEGIIMRAAGVGDMRFVQIALAKLNGVSIQKAGLMMFDGGPLGLKALCDRAELSASYCTFLRAALVIYRDFQLSAVPVTDKQMQKMMLERILTLPFEFTPEIEKEFCERLDSLSHMALVAVG